MKICLLTYRGNPYSGGQGIYIFYLSRELQRLGHEVHVVSGPPYPELAEGITLHRLESLMLYDAPIRDPRQLRRINTPLRLYEFAATCAGTFPEPFTFSIRAYRYLRAILPELPFDIIHDNQCLASGLLLMKERLGLPVVATIHHPIAIDRQIELEQAPNWWQRFRLRRFYSFVGMQHKVSPRLDRIITVSERSARDIHRLMKVSRDKIRVILNGVDTEFFRHDSLPREPQRLIMVSSGNGRTKGLNFLLQALVKIKDETDARLTVVGNNSPDAEPSRLAREYGLQDRVTFTGRIERTELARLYATADIAVVPSLHEGFGLPAAEAMSSGLPVISTRAGALPEVVGEDGRAGILIPSADPDALAAALRTLLGNEELRRRMGEAGRRRVEEHFSWRQTARRTVEVYEEVLRC